MKYLSLFSGIGGFEKAIQDVLPNAECVGYSEIDKFAIQIYQKHFPTHHNFGDITQVDVDALSDFDLLVGGSPCQDLSIAKRDRKGLDGSRSGLFYKYVEILQKKKPRHFILENVASMPKESKDQISQILNVQPIMINAALVSAQQRKRLFWIGELINNQYKQTDITLPEDKKIFLKDILIDGIETKEKSLCVTATYSRACPRDYFEKHSRQLIKLGHFNSGGQADRVYSIEGKSVTLSALGGGRGAKTGLYCIAQRGRYNQDGLTTQQQLEPRLDGKTNSLTTVQKDNLIGNVDVDVYRKLHPIECERLQCLPDDWTEGLSNSQRYKCLGNAVNVEVVKHILTFIK